jgi:beta-N-acetylhexosaminidase
METAPEMSLSHACGQLLIGGFDGLTLPPQAAAALEGGRLGGVVLFRRNVDTLPQLVALTGSIHAAAAPLPPWVAVDQEGGPVRRITEAVGATPIPSMRRLGQTYDLDLVAKLSEVIASELSVLGFNLNFAPVLDVDTNPQNPIIAARAFSSDPDQVARMAGAFFVGHLIAGVAACGKHFPGHGDTSVDSHAQLPVLMHSLERLEAVEWAPFRRLIAGGLDMVMAGHLLLPALDAVSPATLSEAVLTGILRERLKFEGVIISDDLEMAAVADRYAIEEMVTQGLRAGLDVCLICRRPALWEAAHRQLLRLGEASQEDRDRILRAAARVRRAKAATFDLGCRWRPGDWASVVGCDAHRAVVAQVEAAADEATARLS